MRFKADLGLAESRLNRRPSNPSTAAPPHRRPVARQVIGSPHRDVHRKFSFLGLFLYRRVVLAPFDPPSKLMVPFEF